MFGIESSRFGRLHVCRAVVWSDEKKPPGEGTESADTGVLPDEFWGNPDGILRLSIGRTSLISPSLPLVPRDPCRSGDEPLDESRDLDSRRRVSKACTSSCTGAHESTLAILSRLWVSGVEGQLSLSISSEVKLPSSEGAAERAGTRRL